MQVCLFCGGDASVSDHAARCDGRQGRIETLDPPPLVVREPEQLARRDDPETSREAAEAIVPSLRELQTRVLGVLRERGAMAQHGLIAAYRDRYGPAPESTIRTRCAELVSAGLVMDSGDRVQLPSGRRAIVWRAA